MLRAKHGGRLTKKYLAIGIAVGVAFGVAVDNLGVGISLGLVFAIIFGAAKAKKGGPGA
jgi:hypothetical protein